MTAGRYPIGYGTRLVSLAELDSAHGGKMHPEYRRRLLAWLAHHGGKFGIGGGWRATGSQPNKPGFAPEGKSFHQTQTFASGTLGYCAVDLVVVVENGVHRAPTWDEVPASGSDEAERWGLHCFIDGEPWHMQPTEIRGWQSWVDAGRPDPTPPTPDPTPDPEDPDMLRLFKLDKSTTLFAATGVFATHVQPEQWTAIAPTAPKIEQIDRAAAVQFTFVGHPPAGYRGIWANA